jgi:cyclic beta-1,2-glucan synthetase
MDVLVRRSRRQSAEIPSSGRLRAKPAIESPFRGELFGMPQLEQHARMLAAQHQVTSRSPPKDLLPRLAENEAILREYNLQAAQTQSKRTMTPAAEWLLDNFYLVKEQIVITRRHLPKNYSRELPKLLNGPAAGYPRVYDLVTELIRHVDGRVTMEHLSAFVAAYETIKELTLGELWAIPIMLRLALIENLRRIVEQLTYSREHRDLADAWAERMMKVAEANSSDLFIVIAELAQSSPPLTSAFVAELSRRLQGHGPTLQHAAHWLEQRLADEGRNLEELVQLESQMQAADQVSVGNSITSLRTLGALDWREFVETLSFVEQTLRTDPARIYPEMDFSTRDSYRHVVEYIARRCNRPESEVARVAIELAQKADAQTDPRVRHVGFHLVDGGREQIENQVGAKLPIGEKLRRGLRRRPLLAYVGTFLLLTLVLTAWSVSGASHPIAWSWHFVGLTLLLLIGVSHVAISLVNWLVTLALPPRVLPRMNFPDGIPAEHRTIVVVPTMLTNLSTVDTLLERLEIHYLANRDANLYFALLTDFVDAEEQTAAPDETLLHRIHNGIVALNNKYARDRSSIFFLFHRPRRWNPQERLWMGWERKRGKLQEFDDILRGASAERFSDVIGDLSLLGSMQHVITLDTDTQLPRDAAKKLIGNMAHILNAPRLDPQKRIVTVGYGILQPRVAVSLPSAERSWFARLFAGETGIDPYTKAISDVYQDLFGEGSFIGKGMYDVRAFSESLRDRFTENEILSHDLIESGFARSALVSDVEFFEEHPSRYIADANRRHRWIRGDWQIARWLWPRVRTPSGKFEPNQLSVLSRWKIFDNLRRSIVPISLVVLLALTWLGVFSSAGLWTTIVIGIVLIPGLFTALAQAARKSEQIPWSAHWNAVGTSTVRNLAIGLFTLVLLPFEAYLSLDAIVRSCWRMFASHQKLLEWQTATEAERNTRTDFPAVLGTMWGVPAFAVGLAIAITIAQPKDIECAAALLALWLVSPVIAWWMSLPLKPAAPSLSDKQIQFLQKTARKTWRFFETFINDDDHWLPPDNFQENPREVLASRTSPTNIGLSMLASLGSWDFGYITTQQLLERVTRTLNTLDQLERHRGHFYNWYDTRTLKPLLPLYLSSVDSGNFAAHTLTLRSGLLELPDLPIANCVGLQGLGHTALALSDSIKASATLNGDSAAISRQVTNFNSVLSRHIDTKGKTPKALADALIEISKAAAELEAIALNCHDSDCKWWAQAISKMTAAQLEELQLFTPWVVLPPPPEELTRQALAPTITRLNEFTGLIAMIERIPNLRDAARFDQTLLPLLNLVVQRVSTTTSISENGRQWLDRLSHCIQEAARNAKHRMDTINALAHRCSDVAEMDFKFLFDESRELFSIGYNATDHRMDGSYYDLLASEARLTSYLAISQYQVQQDHWFALGRILVSPHGAPVLVSWSGSMFEYLMPMLVMPSYENTLLDRSCKAAVQRQIEYGKERGVPWGFSESGYYMTDAHLNYQYRAFGVPGLGLKRGLAEDLVVAPYATMMALIVCPTEACENLQRLSREGREGRYGFYEAIDYTPSRLRPGQTSATVQSFMAHHQGMGFLALVGLLRNKPMQRRFRSYPLFKSTELLLQERVPKIVTPLYPGELEAAGRPECETKKEEFVRVFTNPNTPFPEVHLLSNGRYTTAITTSGAGFTQWKGLAVTRWREDTTRDCYGSFCYVRDLDTGEVTSTGYQPTTKPSRIYESIFTQGRAEFRRRIDELDLHTTVSVSPEDDVELRRLTITNRSNKEKLVELTTYAEVVLAQQTADVSHPAFSNLFVETEVLQQQDAILCKRRPRSQKDQPPFYVHMMLPHGAIGENATFETDRNKFLGRCRTPANPQAMDKPGPLGNSDGPVLDPIISIRRVIRLAPDQSARVDLIFGISETRDGAMHILSKYRDATLSDRVMDLAWTHSQVVLHQLNATEADAQLFGRLATSLIYAHPFRRAAASTLIKNKRGQSALWAYGISGDLPIALVFLTNSDSADFAKKILQAHAYWRLKGLHCDLVVLTQEDSVYRQSIFDQVIGMVAASTEANLNDRPGGIFIRRLDQIQPDDQVLLQTVARLVLSDTAGTLAEQTNRRVRPEPIIPQLIPVRRAEKDRQFPPRPPEQRLKFYNGLGGFSPEGDEYVITLQPGQVTPAPWVNVIANPQFGTVLSESGSAYTWFENSHEYRLTKWFNDAVSDLSGEAFYIRDEETGEFWSPTPLPTRGSQPYSIRHGAGYSVFNYSEYGIESELTIFVAKQAPVKFAVLRVRNTSSRPKRLSAFGYWEWVLGELRTKNLLHIVTELDPRTGAMLARNAYNTDFPGRVAFVDVQTASRTVTGDRSEFLGRNGSLAQPAALRRLRLSGRVGASFDPCSAVQVQFELAGGQEREIIFRLGAARDSGEVQQLIERFKDPATVHAELDAVKANWDDILGAVQVETPDPALDLLANQWLIYQTLGCRVWARSGYYQSSGAFGFRDQLQDTMALVHCSPQTLRDQILYNAAHQFVEGDVQHWWHPPTNRGVRTHFSDDYLWLPYAVCRYVFATGDYNILNESVHFIEGRPLKPEEEAYFDLPRIGPSSTLYEHCVRAVNNGLKFGKHGIPLIGCGDWNDGMNLVGEHGKGESVWLAFFLHNVLTQFAQVARHRHDDAFARKCLEEAERLYRNIEQHAWDGCWYRRAWFDDGTPLGSAENEECQIDSIPQSWSIISGVGERSRQQQAMDAVDQRLVRRDGGLIQLFTPPFDKSPLNPGYIKGYVPGIRENGGQYTHAAVWTIIAFTMMGDHRRAWELFRMIIPPNHSRNADEANLYKVEPYVVVADIYGVPPHVGRGGWTWYTGSAGWLYRLVLEYLLGVRREGDKLRFAPCVPPEWKSFKVHYRFNNTRYHIELRTNERWQKVQKIIVDRIEQPGDALSLTDDGKEHNVEVWF